MVRMQALFTNFGGAWLNVFLLILIFSVNLCILSLLKNIAILISHGSTMKIKSQSPLPFMSFAFFLSGVTYALSLSRCPCYIPNCYLAMEGGMSPPCCL